MIKILLVIIIIISTINCSNRTIYSGKVINQEDFKNINFKNKVMLIEKFGYPSYIDPIENKYFYFYEKINRINPILYEEEYSYVFVYSLDNKGDIYETKVYDLKNNNDIELVKNQTQNSIIKRGLLEKIFGGVGTQQELPTTP